MNNSFRPDRSAAPDRHAAPGGSMPATDAALPEGRRNFMTAGRQTDPAKLYAGAGLPDATLDALAPLAARLVDDAYLTDAQPGSMPAGYTFLAQLLAHDIAAATRNADDAAGAVPAGGDTARRNGLMLDSIFGPMGRIGEPQLYRFRASASDPGRPVSVDLKWRGDVALVHDTRNADTPMLAQLSALFILLYDHARSILRGTHRPAEATRLARGVTAGVFHAILRQDLLPRLLHPSVWAHYRQPGRPMADAAAQADDALVPVEFTNAAFRFGHAMVRSIYLLNDRSPALSIGELTQGFTGLEAQREINSNFWRIDWRQFFELGAAPQMSRRIGPNVPPDLERVTQFLKAAGRFATSSAGKNDIALKDLGRGVGANVQSVAAMADALLPHLADKPGMDTWALWTGDGRRSLVQTWLKAAPGTVPDHLMADPPPYLYVLIEAGDLPSAKGCGAGRTLGALGSVLAAEAVLPRLKQAEARLAGEADLPAARAAVLGGGNGPATMPELIRFLTDLH